MRWIYWDFDCGRALFGNRVARKGEKSHSHARHKLKQASNTNKTSTVTRSNCRIRHRVTEVLLSKDRITSPVADRVRPEDLMMRTFIMSEGEGQGNQ